MEMEQDEQKQDYFKTELHVHPFFESHGLKRVIRGILRQNYSLEHVIDAAVKKNLDVLALVRLNKEIFPGLLERSKKLSPRYKSEDDYSAIQIFDKERGKKLYLLKAIELSAKQNLHLIVVGNSKVKPNSHIEETIENAIENDCLVIFDHPFADSRNPRKDIGKEKEAEVERICKRYSGNICLEWNAYCIPWVRKLIGGGDVNKKVERLSAKLTSQGYNVPVITDSDIHARYKWSLDEIDKASMSIKKQAGSENSGKAIISNLKEGINSGNYKSNKKYISLPHLVFNFGLPILLRRIYKRPRG